MDNINKKITFYVIKFKDNDKITYLHDLILEDGRDFTVIKSPEIDQAKKFAYPASFKNLEKAIKSIEPTATFIKIIRSSNYEIEE
jgi:hypothetical protein